LLELVDNENIKRELTRNLCEIFLFYNSDTIGRIPILIYPSEEIKYDKEKMYIINIHTVWFIDLENGLSSEHTELEYGDKIYFAEKYKLKSRIKQLNYSDSEEKYFFGEIIIIVVVPINFTILGRDLLKLLSEGIISHFEFSIYYLIESEMLKSEKIKTAKIMDKIGKGEKIKNQIKILINNSYDKIFSNIIEQKSATIIKEQKAISYCSFRDLDVNYIISYLEDGTQSIIKVFKPNKYFKEKGSIQDRIEILSLNVEENGRELEILVQNQYKVILNEVLVKIIHVKEFFEEEIMNERVDFWTPQEEILIISPIIPTLNEYIFLILENQNNERIFEKKINCHSINKIRF